MNARQDGDADERLAGWRPKSVAPQTRCHSMNEAMRVGGKQRWALEIEGRALKRATLQSL
jgi:hypothetical protein